MYDLCRYLQQLSEIRTVHITMHGYWQSLGHPWSLKLYDYARIMATYLQIIGEMNCQELENYWQ